MRQVVPFTTRTPGATRLRRLRRTETVRRIVRETTLRSDDFVLPLFVAAGSEIERPIKSMPGHMQRSVDRLDADVEEALGLGIPAMLPFGIPASKDPIGSAGWDPEGPVPSAIRSL